MTPVQVHVSRDHIRRGRRGSGYDCMIALAIREALGTNTVSVWPGEDDSWGIFTVSKSYESEWTGELPVRATFRAVAFDKHAPRWMIRPFTFTINVPDHLAPAVPHKPYALAA